MNTDIRDSRGFDSNKLPLSEKNNQELMVSCRSNSDKTVDKNVVNQPSGIASASLQNLKEESKDKNVNDIKEESDA